MTRSHLSRRRLLQAGAAATMALPTLRLHAQAIDLTKVKLRVGDQVGAQQALLKASGLIGEIPYPVEWSQYPAAVNLHEALKADATDIGAANDSPTVNAIAGGSKVRVVAAWHNGGRGTSLLVPKGSAAQKVADLRGKTICPTTRGSVAHYLVVGLLKEAGLSASDVKLAFLSPTDATAAFGSGSIDAWATWGIFRSRAIGTLGARILDSGERINSGLLVLSATPGAMADPGKLAAIRHYAALQDRAYAWGRANRDAWVDFYAGFAKQDKAIAATVFEENVAYQRVPIDDAFVGRLKQTHQVWRDNGLLTGSLDLDAHVLRDARA